MRNEKSINGCNFAIKLFDFELEMIVKNNLDFKNTPPIAGLPLLIHIF